MKWMPILILQRSPRLTRSACNWDNIYGIIFLCIIIYIIHFWCYIVWCSLIIFKVCYSKLITLNLETQSWEISDGHERLWCVPFKWNLMHVSVWGCDWYHMYINHGLYTFFCMLTTTLAFINSLTTSILPCWAAKWIAVAPLYEEIL